MKYVETEHIMCPYCGDLVMYADKSGMNKNDDEAIDYCEACDKEFITTCNITRTFTTEEIKEE